MISCGLIPTFITGMNPFTEFFFSRMSTAFWANLTGVLVVNFLEVFTSLPADPRQQISELTETAVKHLLTQESLSSHFEVKIFNKNHVCLVTEKMASLKARFFLYC